MHLRIERHTGNTIVTARHNADEFAVRGTVLRDCHGRVSRLGEKIKHPAKCCVRTDVRVTADKARFIVLYSRDHSRLCLDGLRAIDERYAALLGEGNRHGIVGDRLHDRRSQRDIHRKRRLFITAKLDERRTQGNIRGEAFRRGVARYEQILSERMRRFSVIMRQGNPSFPLFEGSTEKLHPFISASLNFSVKYTRFHALCQPINQYEKHMRMDKNSLRVSHSLREFSKAITTDLQMVPKAGVEPARCSHSGRF